MNLFVQEGPHLADPWGAQALLQGVLRRRLPEEVWNGAVPEFQKLGAEMVELRELQRLDRQNEPRHIPYDDWGNRIDHVELTALWKRCPEIVARHGLVSIAYERPWGDHSRLVQLGLMHLFHPVSDVYTCPLAMTDGAARTLLASGNRGLIERALPHLTARDATEAWTSGQWMTELTGGSDVGATETIARLPNGADPSAPGAWRLTGRKWFTSACTSEMALALARPEGNPAGGKGLALYYLEPRSSGADGRPTGSLQGIEVCRLKDKLGTRKLPTAELLLHDAPATLVSGTTKGIAAIAPMLQVTRSWNSMCATATMAHVLALADDYAKRRTVFGRRLADQPLHQETMAHLWRETARALELTVAALEALGRTPPEQDDPLVRVLTALAKLYTGRAAVEVVAEGIEVFGGAGYVEDTGLPALMRDAQVLPIWEGTTNVLALEVLRALRHPDAFPALRELVARAASGGGEGGAAVLGRLDALAAELVVGLERPEALERGARRLALGLARAVAEARLSEDRAAAGSAAVSRYRQPIE